MFKHGIKLVLMLSVFLFVFPVPVVAEDLPAEEEPIEENIMEETAEEDSANELLNEEESETDVIPEEPEADEEIIDQDEIQTEAMEPSYYLLNVLDYYDKYQAFINDSRWKNGVSWDYDQGQKLYTGWYGFGCFAYASDFVKYMFGETLRGTVSDRRFTDASELRSGDVVNTGEYGQHWVVILERNGNSLYTAEGNYAGKVKISRTRYQMIDGMLINNDAGEAMFVCGYHYDLRFSDVYSPSQYYYDAVYWAVEKDITQGTSSTSFSPSGFCKRYHFVLFLWRQAGSPEPGNTENPFADISEEDEYYEAVMWAYENNITTGVQPDLFAPKDTLTRGQVVTFLYRTVGEPPVTDTENPFDDVMSDKFYYEPVLWAAENTITTGVTPSEFRPSETCTRGQTVVFMYRLFH